MTSATRRVRQRLAQIHEADRRTYWNPDEPGAAAKAGHGASAALNYATNAKVCRGLIEELSRALDQHKTKAAQDSGNYAYAGDLSKVEQDLRDILAFLRSSD